MKHAIGDRIGRLVVLSITKYKRGFTVEAQCDCGNIVKIGASLVGPCQSCGCMRRDQAEVGKRISYSKRQASPHGSAAAENPAEYTAWFNMVSRCHKSHHPSFSDYGARGITVCEQWRESFSQFLHDIGKRPSGKHSIERVDNMDGYRPGNCVWATISEQNRNTRRTKKITFNGETKCMSDWARQAGIHPQTLKQRIETIGMAQAMSLPVRHRKHNDVKRRVVLTELLVKEIRSRHAAGETYRAIANSLNVSPDTVAAAGNGRSWSQVQ